MSEGLSSLDLANSKLSDAQKLTIEAHELLKEDLERVRQERVAFEEITKTLKEVHFGSSVKLNVGGKIYKTTLSTLRKDPNSMLSAMFSGRHELKQDEDEAYFIDRDGKLFRYVLNYLRNDELFCRNDKMLRNELLVEAKFYQLQGMIVFLMGQLDGKSEILKNENLLSIMTSWLPSRSTFSLLFRASADGMSGEAFHRCCDNKGPTLVVVKSETNIFGGFTSKSWESPEIVQFKADNGAFLFTLVNPGRNGSAKINLKSGQNGGIRCQRDLGPTFGTSTYYDFQLLNKGNSNSSNLDLGYGFTCPPNVDNNKYFTGKTALSLDEVEVFEVNF